MEISVRKIIQVSYFNANTVAQMSLAVIVIVRHNVVENTGHYSIEIW